MPSIIRIKRSTTAGATPGSLQAGELAINLKDRKLFSSNGTAVFAVGDYALGNTNAYIATRASWTALTSTNTALRTLISDRLQVANAATIYQTKAVERAALANTNAYIATRASWTALTGTNTALRTLISDRYQVANVNTLLAARATWTALTSTNTALRTLINDRYQVANVNTLLAAKASWVGLTSTNTALRTLISDRLQVANAATIYQTKAVERAALANTNASIATQTARVTLVNTNLTGTNTALRTLISDRLQVANASTLYTTKVNPTTSGVFAHTGRATISTNLVVSGNTTVSTNFNVTGTSTFTGAATFNGAVTLGDAATDLTTINGRATIAQNLNVSGNTTLGGALKTITTTGLLAHTGRATISTNLAVTGNTTVSGVIANNSLGINGYYLRTNGTTAFWSPAPATAGFATWAALTATNTALRTLISDRLQVANAATLYATKVNPSTSGLLAHTGRMTIGTNLRVSGNTIIDGDLTVEGGVTYISTSTLNVDDSMIKLASNNASDIIDTGAYAKYVEAATTKFTGYFRDASDGIFKFYSGLQTEPTTTVNTGAVGYALAQVDAVIDGGTY